MGRLLHRRYQKWWIMEQAVCSWKHATKPQLSQELCWNMRNCAEELPKEALEGGGGSFWDPAASWEGNVLWSKGRNVVAVVRAKWELFWNGGGCRWKCGRWAWTLGGGRNHEESWDRGWQLRHTNALSVFGFSLSVSRDAGCLQMWDESRVQTRTDGAEDFINQ